jgi:hypothetical protein
VRFAFIAREKAYYPVALQRSRASLRLPRVAAISLPTSRPVRWLRPAMVRLVFSPCLAGPPVFLNFSPLCPSDILSKVRGQDRGKKPYEQGGVDFSTFDRIAQIVKCYSFLGLGVRSWRHRPGCTSVKFERIL